ncbi:MAG: DUF488 domain-containing protein [Bacteroidales bacterium]|nr:DUF488 domain-containing protein [Bacteroidales bacterium]
MEFFTLGVYNSDEDEFFGKLAANGIDTFCDIRQRRGVRGAKYTFVNSKKLQAKLNQMGIRYLHVAELAPPPEMRRIQKQTDLEEKKLKRERAHLANAFIAAYKSRILKHFDFTLFINNLEKAGGEKIVFFCVEEYPEACHRSLVANEIQKLGYKIKHL